MKFPNLPRVEDRLRTAYTEAADTVQWGDISPHTPLDPWSRTHTGRWRHLQYLVPVAAAVTVLLVIAVAAVILPGGLPGGGRPAAASAAPKYMAAIGLSNPADMEIRDVATGAITAEFRPNLSGDWDSLAAEGPRTFVGSVGHQGNSYFIRIRLTSSGTLASLTHVGRPIEKGIVIAATVNAAGTRVGYLTLTSRPDGFAVLTLYIANLTTGKVIASWPVDVYDLVSNLSIDAAGTAMSVSTYHWVPVIRDKRRIGYDLTQRTYLLRPATSGRTIDKLTPISTQAGASALSPNGKTLYEFLQAGHVTQGSWASHKIVTFKLTAINTATGRATRVLHTWRSTWASFDPLLALDPTSPYLLVVDGTSVSTINTATGRYTRMPALTPPLQGRTGRVNINPVIDPLAW
jgi:hypothetical protein